MTNFSRLRHAAATAAPSDLIVRSPVIGWIFAVAAVVSLMSMLLMLPSVLARPTPFGLGIVIACGAYAALCAWCWVERRRQRRGVLTVGLFAWATISFIGAAAVPQRTGVNTIGFMVLPAFLFMITVLGHRTLSRVTLLYAGMVFGGVALHHRLHLPEAVRADGLSQVVIAAGLMAIFALLGDQISRIVTRQVSQARRLSEDYRVLFERLPVGAILHRERQIVDCNEQAQTLFQAADRNQLIGRDVLTLLPEAEQASVLNRIRQLDGLNPGGDLPLRDLNMLGLQGRPIPVSVTAVSLDPDQHLILVLIVDRTRQEQAERDLAQSQRLVEALFRTSVHTMAVTDRETGEFLLVNPAYARVVGREPEDMIGRTSVELGLVKASQRAESLRQWEQQGSPQSIRLQLVDVEGGVHELRQSLVATEFDGRQVLVAVGRDITEEAWRERELEAILQSAPAAILVARHGRLTAASAHYERLLRLPPGSAIGRPCDADVGGPEAFADIADRWNASLRAGMIVSYEHPVSRADGTTFPGLFTGRVIKPGARDGFGMVWVIEDMTDRHERETRLARAKADAEAASRAKTGFLATMSHEIRTPLNGILGLIDLVRDPTLDASTRQGYLEMMGESAQSLQEIVSDVLDVSRIESGRLTLEPQVFDLAAWLQSVRASFSALAEAKGLVLETVADPADLGRVRGDPTRLRQILANYLSNALKFTLRGRIMVRLRRLNAKRLRLEVQDTGIGIPEDSLPRLFQPYTQLDAAAHGARGSGLGLSICRQLAELMGGTTGVDSEHGGGSCFWAEVDLPRVPQGGERTVEPAPEEPPPVQLEGLRLLVVDDNRINLVVARRLLERAGAFVDIADGGQAALDAVDRAHARGEAYDLVLMDIQMPGMDGLQALAALRSRPHGSVLPVLAASAAVTTEEVDLTRAAGFDGFIGKPLELGALTRAVRDASTCRRAFRF